MTRAVGFSLLLASAIFVSFELVASHRRRISHTEAALRLVSYIRGNIDLFLTPVAGILSAYSDRTLEDCGFGEAMREQGLPYAVEQRFLSLSEDTAVAFAAFTATLGSSYRDEEVKRCELFEHKLAESLESERTRLEKNRSLYRFVPTLCALSLILAVL